MAIAFRSRTVADLHWEQEAEARREQRRHALCELDGLLTELEECNLRGLQVSGRVRVMLSRHGVQRWRSAPSPELIEAIFEVQERYMLQPETSGGNGGHARDLDELRRRMAS